MALNRRSVLLSGSSVLLFSLLPWDIAHGAGIVDVRMWPADEYTRVTIEHDGKLKFRSQIVKDTMPVRIVTDIEGLALTERMKSLVSRVSPNDPYVKSVRIGQNRPNVVRLVMEMKEDVRYEIFELAPVASYKRRLVIDIYPKNPAAAADDPLAQVLAQSQTSASSSQTQVSQGASRSGKVLIMIDPGHGGEDPGAIGASGTREKDIVLSIARKLEGLIAQDSQFTCRLTRRSDYFVPLGERVRLAQKADARMLVSIHADAWTSSSARGSSVFALSDRGASSSAARWLAKQQNDADRIGGINLNGASRAAQNVIADMSSTWKINYSLALGDAVLKEIGQLNTLHRGRVEQAGFAVLKGPQIPSILVETAFISNPQEEMKLRNENYQTDLARGILSGLRTQFRRDKTILEG